MRKEAGILGVKFIDLLEQDKRYAQIEFFRVHEKFRNQGIGKQLLQCVKEELKQSGCEYILVYPNSDPYEGESYFESEELYEVYQHLGFSFTKEDIDLSRPNSEMKLFL